jgi:polyvinyl alcohol dehydrogenase (cytochrome)
MADPFRREGGPPPRPGVYAVRIADGATLWQWSAPAGNCAWSTGRCLASNSAAATAIPGVVFAGGSDGHLRAYGVGDGAAIWDFDTAGRAYDATNGGAARGGSIDNGGPVVAGGMVLVNSGYGRQLAHAGNALFAFTPDGR